MNLEKYLVPEHLSGYRLDKSLSLLSLSHSRNQIQKAFKEQRVYLNGVIISSLSNKVKYNDLIELRNNIATNNQVTPAKLHLDIIYEDSELIVLNKNINMTIHPGAGTHGDTLVDILLYQKKQLSNPNKDTLPGIVHRLDRNTSGLMVIAKTNQAHQSLSEQIANRSLQREYKALIWGTLQPLKGSINLNIGRDPIYRQKMTSYRNNLGKTALTHYEVVDTLHNGLFSLVKCKLVTGRTHQIRVHLSHIGHSIVGDPTYGQNMRKIKKSPTYLQETLKNFDHQALHAYYISFQHPKTGCLLEFTQKLPEDYQELIRTINTATLTL